MIVTRTPVTAYAYLFLAMVVGWPFLMLVWTLPIPLVVGLAVLNTALLALVWHYCSSPVLSFVNGIHILSARLSSGCLNLTVIYLLPFLAVNYLLFIGITLLGLARGRKYTQDNWVRFVGTQRLGRRLAYSAVAIVLITGSAFSAVTWWPTPTHSLQALTASMSEQLKTRLSTAVVPANPASELNTGPVLVVWADTGTLCTDVQELIPSSYWPKNAAEINDGYLVGITKENQLAATYGEGIGSDIDGYQVDYVIDVVQGAEELGSTHLYGADLPSSIQVDQSSTAPYYGTPPSSESVASWIEDSLRIKSTAVSASPSTLPPTFDSSKVLIYIDADYTTLWDSDHEPDLSSINWVPDTTETDSPYAWQQGTLTVYIKNTGDVAASVAVTLNPEAAQPGFDAQSLPVIVPAHGQAPLDITISESPSVPTTSEPNFWFDIRSAS